MDNITTVTDLLTNFRDEACPEPEPQLLVNGNLHYYHVKMGFPQATCVFCHDPHGTTQTRMAASVRGVTLQNLTYDSGQGNILF